MDKNELERVKEILINLYLTVKIRPEEEVNFNFFINKKFI